MTLLSVLGEVLQYQTISDNIWIYLTIFDDIEQHLTIPNKIWKILTTLDKIWQYSTILLDILQYGCAKVCLNSIILLDIDYMRATKCTGLYSYLVSSLGAE